LLKRLNYYKSAITKFKANLVYKFSVPVKERKSGLQSFTLDKNVELKKDIDFKKGKSYLQSENNVLF